MGTRRRKLLFISPNQASFVRQDIAILEQQFDVRTFTFGSHKGFSMLFQQVKLLIWLLSNLAGAKNIYIWFADYHSWLPTLIARVFGRRSFLVIGGYDAALLPQFNYGGHVKAFRSRLIAMSCKWATTLLPVSEFVNTELSKRIGRASEGKRKVVLNGIDLKVFEAVDEPHHARQGVICVSLADSVNRLMIKGLDLYAEVARRIPEEQFVLIGVTGDAAKYLGAMRIANLVLRPGVSRAELQLAFRKAKVVCQFSRFESFGMVIAEGMLCGCVPVVSEGTGTSEVVGDGLGKIVIGSNPDDLAAATREALKSSQELSVLTANHIRNNFDIKIRARILKSLLGN